MADDIQNTGLETVHDEVRKMAPLWRKVRDAVSGEAAIHAAGVKYLPKLKDEPEAMYRARVARTPWFNATWRTLAAYHGMIFRKEPTVTAPAGLTEMLKDVTLTGVPFVNFLKELGHEVLGPGLAGVLVDHPPRPDTGNAPLTVAKAEALGLRPVMALYKCESFINWKFRRINNKWTLSQLRLKENVKEDKGEFDEKSVEQIRVLDLNPGAADTYRQRLYRKNGFGRWEQHGPDIVPLLNGKPLEFIPFLFVTPNGIVAELDEPSAIDLVDLNFKHYGVSADYEHACHFTALPTPYIAGLGPTVGPDGKEKPVKMYIGSPTAWVFPNHETKVGFLEYTGQGIDAIEKNLARKEAQMAAIGARMLAPEKSGVEASDTLAMRHSGEQSVVHAIRNALNLAGEKALEWFALWAAQAGETALELNKNFMPKGMDSATFTALIGGWQQGALSEQELYEVLQDGEVIKSDKSFEDHKDEVDANPPMGMLGAQAAIDALNDPDPAVDDKTGKDNKDDEK